MWEYSEKVYEHFFNPRNMGEIVGADAVADVGNIACGDALRLSLKIEDGKIADAKFKTFGCGSAIAAASALTELIKGKTVEEALKLTNDDIAEFLDGLPPEKMHCSVMGQEALQKAIAIFHGQKMGPAEQAEYLCKCFLVTEAKIREVVKENHLRTVEDVTHYTKAGGGCGKCIPKIEQVLKEVEQEQSSQAATPPTSRLTNIQLIAKIQEAFEKQIRPDLRLHNGDAELVDVSGSQVLVRLKGACEGCPNTAATLKGVIQKRLVEWVDPALEVEEAPR